MSAAVQAIAARLVRGLAVLVLAFAATLAHAGAVISSGVATIGVNDQGNLIFQGVGLRYVPTNGEALAPGCACEGWGIADMVTRAFGKAGAAFGVQNVVVESFTSTSSTARSVVRVMNGATPVFRVTHEFRVAPETANLFEVTVTVANLLAATVDVRYRRAMDWDVPPTTFSELVTIVTNAAQDVVFASDNGFADGNPLVAAGQILFTGERANSGPADHGAVFDFNLGTLAPAATRVFRIYYGAAAHEPAALQALANIGAEVYSLGKPNTPTLTPPGSPNTFIFGFKGVGGTPAVLRDADLTLGGLDVIDNGAGEPISIVARLGNAGGKDAANFNVAFYDGNPAQPGAVLLATRNVALLASEDFIDIRIDGIASLSGKDVYAFADREARIRECSVANNVVSIAPRPRVTLGGIVASTDRASYAPNTPATLSAAIGNPGRFPYDYTARLRVEDAGGVLVAQFDARSVPGVAAGGSASVSEAWNTGLLAAGTYRLTADLFDAAAKRIATSTVAFAIETGVTGSIAGAAISTDKSSYASLETVQITDRVSNRSVNTAIDGLVAVTTVLAPDGAAIFTQSAPVGALAAGGERTLRYSLPLANAAAGNYRALLSVRDAAGVEQASAEAAFTVLAAAQSGAGLRGTIAASPKSVEQGEAVVLTAAVMNDGNADIAALPVKLSLVDGETGVLLQELPYSINVARSGRFDIAASWNTASARVGATVFAVLSAEAGGRSIPLAQDTFVVLEPPIRLGVDVRAISTARVLVLVSCKPGALALEDNPPGVPDDVACIAGRVAYIGAYLTALGVRHAITTTPEAFEVAFRGGAYNVYWLTGGSNKLKATLAEEVREAVFRGDGLLRDGMHDERNLELDAIAGIVYRGKLGTVDQPAAVTGALFAPGTIASLGRPLKLELGTAIAQAAFAAGDAAIVSNAYGSGAAVQFAFDLVATLHAGGDAAYLRGVVEAALARVTPPVPPSHTGGAYATARIAITNQAREVEVTVKATLPAGATVADTLPAATIDAEGNATWSFTLPETQTQALVLGVRVPATSGSHELQVTVTTTKAGVTRVYGTYPLPLTVARAEEALPALLVELAGLALASTQEIQLRDRAVVDLRAAQSLLSQARFDEAIAALVGAGEGLDAIASVNLDAQRRAIGLLIQEAAAAWYRALPACPAGAPYCR